ncbi:MAG: UDP-4-amino-4,6-dideoxy-N-acetyl-beta-L-altrosamine transaminase [Porphyromonadaceae bacterium]|nr:MAG: UDP-4-amino-4,6-dideoxy-N-acetyl-beta-L-altrosamine transaminase [Porphyromonadaceae bacterium]
MMDIPYGCQCIDDADVAAVVAALRSDWLTTGPKVAEFEEVFADFTGAKHAVAVSSGTAALHAAMHAIDIGPGDEVIVPPMTFAATANCVVYQGGKPVFVDVDSDTLLIDPDRIEEKITPATKAIIAVDYAGQPCNYERLRAIARKHNLALVADGCHALGAEYKGQRVGALADMTVFSFHPVKHITTGEGGMITTDNPILAERMRVFRNHGITTDHRQREEQGSWCYEMVELGYNYRITDFQCALGVSQFNKLPKWLARRREIAGIYDAAFEAFPYVKSLSVSKEVLHAYHLYVVRIMDTEPSRNRKAVFKRLREKGIGVNVHYLPVHLHSFYKKRFHTGAGLCPVAEQAYDHILSLPMFPKLKSYEQEYVIKTMKDIWS